MNRKDYGIIVALSLIFFIGASLFFSAANSEEVITNITSKPPTNDYNSSVEGKPVVEQANSVSEGEENVQPGASIAPIESTQTSQQDTGIVGKYIEPDAREINKEWG